MISTLAEYQRIHVAPTRLTSSYHSVFQGVHGRCLGTVYFGRASLSVDLI